MALSQLLKVEQSPNRQAVFNRFSQLVADFVVYNRGFVVAAVIELDDRSHDSAARAAADQRKTSALSAAGYCLIRVHVRKLRAAVELRKIVATAPAIVP